MPGSTLNRSARLQVVRQLLYDTPQGLRAVELAELCNVDRRTIYRDLAILAESDVPLRQHGGRFSVAREHYMLPVQITFSEAVALLLAVRLYVSLSRVYTPHLLTLIDKLSGKLTGPLARQTGGLHEVLAGGEDEPIARWLDVVAEAWLHDRKIRVWGRAGEQGRALLGEISPYILEPDSDGGVTLLGYDDLSEALCRVDLRTVRQIELLPFSARAAVGDAVFPPEEIRPGGIGAQKVVLEFSPDAASAAQRQPWPHCQQVSVLDGGGCRLTLQVVDWQPLVGRLLAWGSAVQVQSPAALRQAVLDRARQICALYEDGEVSLA